MEVGVITTWIATKIWWSLVLKGANIGLNMIGFKGIDKRFRTKSKGKLK